MPTLNADAFNAEACSGAAGAARSTTVCSSTGSDPSASAVAALPATATPVTWPATVSTTKDAASETDPATSPQYGRRSAMKPVSTSETRPTSPYSDRAGPTATADTPACSRYGATYV